MSQKPSCHKIFPVCVLPKVCFCFGAADEGAVPDAALWLSFLQAFLLNEDLGDSLDSVEALLKKHEDFEKSLSAQEEKITVRPFLSCGPQSKQSLSKKVWELSTQYSQEYICKTS